MEAAKAEIEAEQAEAEHRRQKIEDAQRREADYWATPAEQRLAGIKPIERYDFKSTPYPHQIEAFNYILKGKRFWWPMSQDLVRQRSPSMHPIILKRLEKRKVLDRLWS